MAMDMPDAAPAAVNPDLPVLERRAGGAPSDLRYSDFLKLVNADKVEKVTFSSDGTQLLGVDTDGSRLKIEALPNDPDLLTQLTTHKVRGLRSFIRFCSSLASFQQFVSLSKLLVFNLPHLHRLM
jgi:hypothetical protein